MVDHPDAEDRRAALETARAYDAEAEATGWFGPEVALGLVYERLSPGQSVLDLGIGTGRAAVLFRRAGLQVHGLDISQEMLAACRTKGLDALTLHDLTKPPYPYPPGSFDHVVCVGVLPFLPDLSPVFAEVARLLRPGGTFVFMTLDRAGDETAAFVVGPEHTKTGGSVTMYRHSSGQIGELTTKERLTVKRNLPFLAYSDAERKQTMRAACYVAVKGDRSSDETHDQQTGTRR